MRLSEYCNSTDVDRAISVTVDSFVGSQKVSCKRALARAFAKYTLNRPNGAVRNGRAGARAGGRGIQVGA
jgi:DNA replication licensing factor MCM2